MFLSLAADIEICCTKSWQTCSSMVRILFPSCSGAVCSTLQHPDLDLRLSILEGYDPIARESLWVLDQYVNSLRDVRRGLQCYHIVRDVVIIDVHRQVDLMHTRGNLFQLLQA